MKSNQIKNKKQFLNYLVLTSLLLGSVSVALIPSATAQSDAAKLYDELLKQYDALEKSFGIIKPVLTKEQNEELDRKLDKNNAQYEKILENGDDNLTTQQYDLLDDLSQESTSILESYGFKYPELSESQYDELDKRLAEINVQYDKMISLDENETKNETKNIVLPCDMEQFATSNSTVLIDKIKSLGFECVNELFNTSSDIQVTAFSSDNMIAVANHVVPLSMYYMGGGDEDIESIFLYLRAGYFAEWNNNDISFNEKVQPTTKLAIDAFVNNCYFYDNDNEHGNVLREVLTTMASARLGDNYIPVVKEWLARWNPSYAENHNMEVAFNKIFTILWLDAGTDDFKKAVSDDEELVRLLSNFTFKRWMVDTDSEYLLSNAALHLGYLKQYEGSSIQGSVDKALNDIFNSSYELYGYGDTIWLSAAYGANAYGDCDDYGICGYIDEIASLVLTQSHVCSDTLKINSQNLTSTQQTSICSVLGEEETYFHSLMKTDNIPITGDMNTQLQINIFDSADDYRAYASRIFDMDTNNGGMYLEGEPTSKTNIPNFIAYEQDNANAPHYVWNLEHEYVHYLDGRFNMFGGFVAPTNAGVNTIWWTEGLAEYVSKKNNNSEAYDTINDGSTYDLTTVLGTNTYGLTEDRVYTWGYLAVRFMFENHESDLMAMKDELRAGDWNAYQTRVNSWANDYDTEFTAWIQSIST